MEKSIKYLGCRIPSRLDNAFHLNYGPPIQNIQGDLNGWKHITVSWSGHINTLKMNVLPTISYLFHQLPVDVPNKQFKDKYVKDACVTCCVMRCTLIGIVYNDVPVRFAFLSASATLNERGHLIMGQMERNTQVRKFKSSQGFYL